jgi:DNA-binding HxlR family transcriptional regulator
MEIPYSFESRPPGPRRFSQIRRLIVGISENIQIQGLKEMELIGIVSRKDFHEVPPRVECGITKFGANLAQAMRPYANGAPNT